MELRSVLRSDLTPSEAQGCPARTLLNARRPVLRLFLAKLAQDSRVKVRTCVRAHPARLTSHLEITVALMRPKPLNDVCNTNHAYLTQSPIISRIAQLTIPVEREEHAF